LNFDVDVVVVGGGPAGIAVAIAASARGLDSIVVDAQMPPIDKPCGEGLLPHGVTALRALGIQLDSDNAYPFTGIRFCDHDSSASAKFSEGGGFALRRVRLHQLLLNRAALAGVSFLWGTRVTNIESNHVTAGGNRIRHQWLVGADGQNSGVRKRANLDSHSLTQKRYAFRKHYRIRPWTDVVEVYWGKGCQAVVTPVGDQEVGVAVFSRNPRLRLEQALPMFPPLAAKLLGAFPTSKELGNMTAWMRLPAVTRDHVALVGDASGTVDALTGHGLSLSFQQALYLAEAFENRNLSHYEAAHRKINAMPATMTRLMMLMERSDWVRRRTLRLFQKKPDLFSKLLSINTGDLLLSSVGAAEIADFGWKFLWA
jgi:menaquinone-9 beta-reductase